MTPRDTLGQVVEAIIEILLQSRFAEATVKNFTLAATKIQSEIRRWDSDYRSEGDFRIVYRRLMQVCAELGWNIAYVPESSCYDEEIPVRSIRFSRSDQFPIPVPEGEPVFLELRWHEERGEFFLRQIKVVGEYEGSLPLDHGIIEFDRNGGAYAYGVPPGMPVALAKMIIGGNHGSYWLPLESELALTEPV